MKIKDLSLTDYISGVSAIGLAISVISQSYFYFRLDALWIMSLISPTIYLFDVVKVIVLLLILLGGVIALEQLYRYLTKKFRHKKKIRYVEGKLIDDLLIKNRVNYERNFYLFLCILICIFIFLFAFLKFKTTFFLFVILGIFLGIVMLIALDKTLSKEIRRTFLGLLLFVGSLLHGEYKYIQIVELPQVLLKDKKSEFNQSKLLEVTKTDAILFQRNNKGAVNFKIISLNQIDKIIAFNHK